MPDEAAGPGVDAQASIEQYVIRTGADGGLVAPVAAVDALVDRLAAQQRIVLHFHGGLVSEDRGMAVARNLVDTYRGAGAYPVFFVWRSGLLEVIGGNLQQIAADEFFRSIEKVVTRFAVAKLQQTVGARGTPLQPPMESDVRIELDRRRREEEPYADLQVAGELAEVSDDEARAFEASLEADSQVRESVAAIMAALPAEAQDASTRSAAARLPAPPQLLLSAEVIEELRREAAAADEGQKGLVTTMTLVKKATAVFIRVVRRFRAGSDHGVYPTVLEEILREFYVASAGAVVWKAMKGETRATFEPPPPERGGRHFVSRLGEIIVRGPCPEITLVGHSTGAVFINNLLEHVERMRADANDPFPADYRFKNVVFLAPACTFADFTPIVQKQGRLFDRFRMFTMTDEAECKDWLVSFVYPRSLLYLVSGLFEGDETTPLVGLQRYYTRPWANGAALDTVRQFVNGQADRVVWSPASRGDGLSAGALHHGDFDDDEQVRASMRYLIGQP